MDRNVGLAYRLNFGLLAGALVLALCLATVAAAEPQGTAIDTGTAISVRTSEEIDAKDSDGRVFLGVVDQDVLNRNQSVAIPRGSPVELLVRSTGNNEMALDLDTITVRGQRYGLDTADSVVSSERADGVGANKRTGEFVGGGALIGAVIGAITGGGKGAGIGAGVGAAAGAGTQVLTRGRSVHVPAEALLTFRLQQPLRVGAVDRSVMRNGVRYRQAAALQQSPAVNSEAYRAGLQAGRSDLDRNRPRNTRSSRWTSAQDRRDYEAGYDQAFQGNNRALQAPNDRNYARGNSRGNIRIGADKNISWEAPSSDARLFVEVDNNPRQLFASGQSGTQLAPWIENGHNYLFILQDGNGNELARQQSDLRQRRRPR